MKQDKKPCLLLAGISKSDTESLAALLRDAGSQAQVEHAPDEAAFEAALVEQIPDVVICAYDAQAIGLERAISILQEAELALPVIAITEKVTESTAKAVRDLDVMGLASIHQPEHLLLELSRAQKLQQLQNRNTTLETSLTRLEQRCDKLVDESRDAIALIDADLVWHPNQSCLELFGFTSREEANGKPLLEQISQTHREKLEACLRGFIIGETEDKVHEVACLGQDGTEFECIVELTPGTQSGKPCIQVLVSPSQGNGLDKDDDTTADIDTLTRLGNRQHFMGLLKEKTKTLADENKPSALIYLTLDGFKEVREENGIATSDKALCSIARLLESNCGSQDSIARFGDFSYTILLHADSSEKIQAMGEKLLHDIPVHLSETYGKSLEMTCSIGVCALTEHAADAEKLLSHADTACEIARSSGGNGIHTHSAVIDEQMSEDHEDQRDEAIRRTVEEKRFYLTFQPIISLKGENCKRYEALLRVVDDEGHTILPGQFLELAEKAGLSREIDYWIFETAFSKISEQRSDDEEITVFLKISRPTLADPQLTSWVLDKLEEYKLPAASVVFQIQEIDSINDLKNAITFVKAMKKAECSVALEHFGINDQTQLLKHVPADIVKLDGSLSDNLAANKDKQARIREIVKVAHELGAVCIAERVDNPGTLAALWQNDVDMIQGNFVQEPDRELDYDFEGEIA